MKLSPLQLTRYVLTDIACKGNPKFNPQKEIQGALEQFSVNVKINALEPEKDAPVHSWSVELDIVQKKKAIRISHTNLTFRYWGSLIFRKGLMQKQETLFVQVNGSSTLYGMAREHIRALTAAGPWGAIILPTVSFYENKEQPKKDALLQAPPESK